MLHACLWIIKNGALQPVINKPILLPAGGYIDFGSTSGAGGYGIRDNGGVIEFKNSSGSWVPIPTGSGTVTSVSVATANGLAGSSSGGSTPVLTLSTTVNGLVKGDGTALSAATAGTDYQAPITLTTTGTSGAATFVGNTLNIPQYAGTVPSIGGTLTGGTTGSVLFSGSGVFAQDNANLFWDATNDRLGVGTSAPTWPLTVTNPVGGFNERLLAVENNNIGTGASVMRAVGLAAGNGSSYASGYGAIWGQKGNGAYIKYADLTPFGFNFTLPVFVANAQSYQSATTAGQTVPLAVITAGNVVQLGMNYPAADPLEIYTGASTTNISFKEKTTNTLLATITGSGRLGIGSAISSPTARLHLPAGTATAGTAPIKLTSGTLLTVVEDGTIEYDGTHFYASIGTTRYQLDQQGGGGGMVYPGVGVAVSTGAAWDTSLAAPIGALVGTTDTQTISNKDLTSGTNTFPTFNQNTTGSAAKWTTARLLAGNSVDGSANVAFANKFIVQGTTDTGLSGAQFLGALATGLVKNTTTTGVLSIATAGSDYSAGTAALATGILKSTTTTGALTIAVAGDFPTLNQNTTGSAATLTTARTIGIATGDVTSAGSTFNGSANNTNAYTLATVNANVGSFTYASITVNGKGLITAASSGTTPYVPGGTDVAITDGGTGVSSLPVGILIGAGTGAITAVTAPSGAVVGTTDTQTTSNKRNLPRTASSTTASTLTPDLSSANIYYRTTQTATLTINAPTGTPVIGETIVIYVTSAAAQTLTFNATYIAYGAALPATTTAGKTTMITAQYDGTNWATLTATQQ